MSDRMNRMSNRMSGRSMSDRMNRMSNRMTGRTPHHMIMPRGGQSAG